MPRAGFSRSNPPLSLLTEKSPSPGFDLTHKTSAKAPGAVPGGSGGRLAIANYLCGSGRLHVHTQLPIIYVGTHTITNCLLRWSIRDSI